MLDHLYQYTLDAGAKCALKRHKMRNGSQKKSRVLWLQAQHSAARSGAGRWQAAGLDDRGELDTMYRSRTYLSVN
jgi:hypothetical protein